MEPVDALERDHDLPRQRTDNPEPEWMQHEWSRTEQGRAARAVAALASEHEQRLAAEVELDRLRTEAEGERERTREALQQAKTAGERWQRAEAEVIRLRREIEVRHHQAEEEHARLVEEADGLGQRLQAAERDAAQLREEESARQSFGRWAPLTAATTSVLLVSYQPTRLASCADSYCLPNPIKS
jgi:septal ring factor EnvC (AmiA/AmiB activator)